MYFIQKMYFGGDLGENLETIAKELLENFVNNIAES